MTPNKLLCNTHFSFAIGVCKRTPTMESKVQYSPQRNNLKERPSYDCIKITHTHTHIYIINHPLHVLWLYILPHKQDYNFLKRRVYTFVLWHSGKIYNRYSTKAYCTKIESCVKS